MSGYMVVEAIDVDVEVDVDAAVEVEVVVTVDTLVVVVDDVPCAWTAPNDTVGIAPDGG